MRFTSNEMMFLHSITPGHMVFGYRFFFPQGEKGKEAEKETIRGLVKKGILESEDRLAAQGVYPARAMENYKKSKRHIILNQLHLALPGNGKMIMMYQVENEYELYTISGITLLSIIINRYSFLCGRKSNADIIIDQPGLNTVLAELYENGNSIQIGEYREQRMVRERVFYQNEENRYIYNLCTGRRYQTDGYRMRMELVNLLGIEEEWKYGKSKGK